jgi:hypothetical protein
LVSDCAGDEEEDGKWKQSKDEAKEHAWQTHAVAVRSVLFSAEVAASKKHPRSKEPRTAMYFCACVRFSPRTFQIVDRYS